MGRPRKRQLVPPSGEGDIPEPKHTSQEFEPLPSSIEGLVYVNGPLAMPNPITGPPTTSLPDDAFTDSLTALINSPEMWLLGNPNVLHGPPIDFGDVNFVSGQHNNVPLSDPVFQVGDPLPTPPKIDGDAATPTNTSSCSCLSSIYLSLAALQQLPTSLEAALRTVRSAASVAANMIWCPHCGAVILDTDKPPLIESFQNTMLLGTLLPTVAHGYQKLLAMVDKETNSAIAANATKAFNLNDYGGLCGVNAPSEEAIPCVPRELLFNTVDMTPIQWRTTVRALLRVDIYGHESPGFKYKGLKDLVSDMEYRQRTRHELLDAAIAAGTLDLQTLGHGVFSNVATKSCDMETPQCLQMIKMAKHAIDQLLIA